MTLTFIDISRYYGPRHTTVDSASLSISHRAPNRLHVSGGLEHATEFHPKTVQDADKLRRWLDQNYPSKQYEALQAAMSMLRDVTKIVDNDSAQAIGDVIIECQKAANYDHLSKDEE